jgi:glucose/arabinose dehydrogenase
MIRTPLFLAAFAVISGHVLSAEPETFPKKPAVQPATAAEEAKTFQMPPGYRMDLVLSEPQIMEPVAISFDGNGRMFVVEMRSYMQDADGKDELKPTSRVSLHWSSKGDGVFDKHTVFADKLLLPRMVLPLGRRSGVD